MVITSKTVQRHVEKKCVNVKMGKKHLGWNVQTMGIVNARRVNLDMVLVIAIQY